MTEGMLCKTFHVYACSHQCDCFSFGRMNDSGFFSGPNFMPTNLHADTHIQTRQLTKMRWVWASFILALLVFEWWLYIAIWPWITDLLNFFNEIAMKPSKCTHKIHASMCTLCTSWQFAINATEIAYIRQSWTNQWLKNDSRKRSHPLIKMLDSISTIQLVGDGNCHLNDF